MHVFTVHVRVSINFSLMQMARQAMPGLVQTQLFHCRFENFRPDDGDVDDDDDDDDDDDTLPPQRLGPMHRTFRSSVSISALENFYFYSRKI